MIGFDFKKANTVREFYESSEMFEASLHDELIASDTFDGSIYKNTIFKKQEEIKVPISKIVGYEKYHMKVGTTILSNFKSFFDFSLKADSYHSRSNSMLEIPFESIMDKLAPSFESEPIKTMEINGKYFINSNGLHRFTALKLAYLIELYYGKKEEELDLKYIIPVKNTSYDELKTFCKLILTEIIPNIYIYAETIYEPVYNLSGNTEISLNNEKTIMTDEELLNYTLNQINNLKNNNMYEYLLDKIIKKYDLLDLEGELKETTVYKLINKYAPSMIADIKRRTIIGGINEIRIN